MLVEYQPSTPSSRAFRPGRDDRLDQRLPGLQILAGQRRLGLRRELDQRRDVGGQVRRRVRVRECPRESPRRRRPCSTESPDRSPRARARSSRSSACAGDSVMKISVLPHQTITSRSRLLSALNLRMSAIDLLGEILLVLALLDVRAVEPLDVALIEHRRPRTDLLELRADLLEQRRLDDAGGPGRGVAVVLENVPAAEHQIVERRRAARPR